MAIYAEPMPLKESTENIRVRLEDPQVRERWKRTLEDRKISQQKAVLAMIEWIIEQDPILQVMLFNQVPEADKAELARLVLKRLSGGAGVKGKK